MSIEAMTINDLLPELTPVMKVAAFYVIGVGGMVSHWAKKVYREKADITLFSWYLTGIKSTILAIGSFVVASWPIISNMDLASATLTTLLGAAGPLGYTVDSAFNSNGTKGDSDEGTRTNTSNN